MEAVFFGWLQVEYKKVRNQTWSSIYVKCLGYQTQFPNSQIHAQGTEFIRWFLGLPGTTPLIREEGGGRKGGEPKQDRNYFRQEINQECYLGKFIRKKTGKDVLLIKRGQLLLVPIFAIGPIILQNSKITHFRDILWEQEVRKLCTTKS